MGRSHRTGARLSPADAKRRIYSARILRGISQTEMDAAGAELGLDAHELGRTERGELPFTPARGMVLCQVLDVPPRWFKAEPINLVEVIPAEDLQAAA